MVTLAGMHVNISYYLNEPECGCNVRTCFVLGPSFLPCPSHVVRARPSAANFLFRSLT